MPKSKNQDTAPYAYEGLDRTLHEKARLGIVTSLVSHPNGLAFADLKKLCDLTDGNLSRHIQVLQDAGIVLVNKGYEGKRPHTSIKLSAQGKKQFLKYLDVLEEIVKDAGDALKSAETGRQPKPG